MIIAVMADKGGVGKTTAAHNLGAELARDGGPVLLIDADKQADLTLLTGQEPEPNIGLDAILRQLPTPSAARYLRPLGERLTILCTHPQMRRADRELAQRTRREYVLEEALAGIRDEYSAIVLDVGHSEMVEVNVLAVADLLLVPTTPAKLDADHIVNMLEEADAVRRDLRLPSLVTPRRVVVSITRRSPTASIEAAGLRLIQENFGHVLAPAIIPFTPRVMEASAVHLSLREYRDRYGTKRDGALSAAVDAYALLADHMLSLAPGRVAVA